MSDDQRSLSGIRVGLSVSDSQDLTAHGLYPIHLEHAAIDFARHLVFAGASLAFGGDLRKGGYTEKLVDVVRTYASDTESARSRLRQYLSPPIDDAMTLKERAWLKSFAELIVTERARPPAEYLPEELRDRIIWADSLTFMRARMTADIDAHVLLGGQITAFRGRYPGVVEEAVLSLRAGKPVYLLGGFGGGVRLLTQLIAGRTTRELTSEALRGADPLYAALESQLPDVDVSRLALDVRNRGIAGLRNGLSVEENRALFESSDVDYAIALVIRGLKAVASAPQRADDNQATNNQQ